MSIAVRVFIIMVTALSIVEWLSASLGYLKMRCNLHPQASGCNHVGKVIGCWRIVVSGASAVTLLLTACSSGISNADPAWSPDGIKIAFAREQKTKGNYDIYVMNADGSNQINLTNSSAQEIGPARSPDGSKIAFNWNLGYHDDIWVMNADGSNQTKLTES